MRVSDTMMTDLVTVPYSTSPESASELMREKRIRHLPVRDESGAIIGIISDRDLKGESGGDVGRLMSWPVLTVHRDRPLREAALGMLAEKISALLVVDDKNAVVGILTTDDLLRKLAELLPAASALEKASYSPVFSELLREAQASGL